MSRVSNLFLASLAEADYELIHPHLKPVELPQGTVLFDIGSSIHQVYFRRWRRVSRGRSGVGRDDRVGDDRAREPCRRVVRSQRAGVGLQGHRSDRRDRVGARLAERLRALAENSAACRAMLFRHEQIVLVQAQQSAACNATHTVEARLARWLLRCRDLQGSDDLRLTQEFLRQMMGVRRTSVSVVANTLQQAGLIRYSRGHIRILDLDGLQQTRLRMLPDRQGAGRAAAGRLRLRLACHFKDKFGVYVRNRTDCEFVSVEGMA